MYPRTIRTKGKSHAKQEKEPGTKCLDETKPKIWGSFGVSLGQKGSAFLGPVIQVNI